MLGHQQKDLLTKKGKNKESSCGGVGVGGVGWCLGHEAAVVTTVWLGKNRFLFFFSKEALDFGVTLKQFAPI